MNNTSLSPAPSDQLQDQGQHQQENSLPASESPDSPPRNEESVTPDIIVHPDVNISKDSPSPLSKGQSRSRRYLSPE